MFTTKKSLFGIVDDFDALFDLLDDPDISEAEKAVAKDEFFKEIADNLANKADGYAAVIKQAKADEDALKAEEKRLAAKRLAAENKQARMKDAIMYALARINQTKFRTQLNTFAIQKNGGKQPLDIYVEPEKLPDKFQKVRIEANSDAIREALAAGEKVEGCVLQERGEHLRLR